MEVTLTIQLPDYLRQWFIFSLGGEPVKFKKGSVLNAFLKTFLRHKRECDSLPQPSQYDVRIVVPKFPGMDPQYYNYLPAKAANALRGLIRDMFDVQLFRDMENFKNISRNKSSILELWMQNNGIEICDRNWNAVAKRLQLLRTRANDRERKKSGK